MKTRSRRIFDIIGVAVVVLWLSLMGTLVRQQHMGTDGAPGEGSWARPGPGVSRPREFVEIYLKGRKVGYSCTEIQPMEGGFLVEEEVFLRLNLMGRDNLIYTNTRSVTDPDFGLESFAFEMRSGVVVFKMRGEVRGEDLHVKIGEGYSARSETLKLTSKPTLGSGMLESLRGRPMKVGDSMRFGFFDPSTMAQKSIVLRVAAKESMDYGGGRVDVLRLEADMWGQPIHIWVDLEGRVLKETGFLGFTLLRSTRERAPAGIVGGGEFYSTAAIQIKKRLSAVGRLKHLRLKLEGLEGTPFDPRYLNAGRQRFRDGILEITIEKPPRSGRLLTQPEVLAKGFEPFLEPEPGIESDAEVVRRTALDLAKGEQDPVRVSRRLLAWVNRRVEKRPVISFPSAVEVLKTRVGDCNEHTALFTALLRALGIPARVCVGLVYMDGAFYYHAWTEAFLGDDWVSMDATLEQVPADATHVKLVEGGLDRQVGIIGLMGRLRVQVAGYDYD